MGSDERILNHGVRRQGLVQEVGLEEPIALVLEGIREAERFVQLRPQEGVRPEPRLDHEEPGRAPRVPVDKRLAAPAGPAAADAPAAVAADAAVARPGAGEGASEGWRWRWRWRGGGREKVATVVGPRERSEMLSTEGRSCSEHFLRGGLRRVFKICRV